MNESTELPTAEERQQFLRKLAELRGGLPASQQRMLDAMILAAFAPGPEGDVQGYEWFYGQGEAVPSDPNVTPKWYQGSEAATWDDTAWAAVYQAVPHHIS